MPVTVDTTALERGLRQLSSGLETGGDRTARAQAETTARDIQVNVPRRSGRLAGTVGTERAVDGWAVTYGGGLPYAGYIEGRSGAVADAVDGVDTRFAAACWEMAAQQVHRL